jgi:hypothetical protein
MYKQVQLNLSKSNLDKIIRGKGFRLNKDDAASNEIQIYLHPENAKKVMAAKMKGRGCGTMYIAPGEIMHDLKMLKGSSFWSWLKDEAYPWIRNNILTPLADVGVPLLATAGLTSIGAPELAGPISIGARKLLKDLTGVGKNQGINKGGSFKLLGKGKGNSCECAIPGSCSKKGGSFRLM